jgi:hypothetical protein
MHEVNPYYEIALIKFYFKLKPNLLAALLKTNIHSLIPTVSNGLKSYKQHMRKRNAKKMRI